MNKKTLIVILILIIFFSVVGIYLLFSFEKEKIEISDFEQCVLKGNIIEESYPRVCRTKEGLSFVEDIGNEFEKIDLIIVNNPRPNQIIESPLIISGRARGFWFFEADFLVELLDENENIIFFGIATAKSEWMTEEFVEFEEEIIFEKPNTKKGKLILHRDNPSGLKENEDSLIIPIKFE